MITLEELNDLRSREKWQEIVTAAREHLKKRLDAYILRGLAQALDKLDQRNDEYEGTLQQLLELKDRTADTAHRLAQYYKDHNRNEEAIRHLQAAIEAGVEENQLDAVDTYWRELVELEADNLPFYINIAQQINRDNHHQRAAALLQSLLPDTETRNDWRGNLQVLKEVLAFTPNDDSLRAPIVSAFENLYIESDMIGDILDFTGIKTERPLVEALEETEIFCKFLPDQYVQHPDWGIGRVKQLELKPRRLMINFQRKRNHQMALDLAAKAVFHLEPDDFRVLSVIDRDGLKAKMKEKPIEFMRLLLKSFGGSLNAKEIKEHAVPTLMTMREWSSWWSDTNSALKKDAYISVSGGSTKTYTLRAKAVSDEDDLLKRFDETRSVHDKLDQIYTYLRTNKKTDVHEDVIKHFAQKLHALTPTRTSPIERVELWYANEDLKEYAKGIESISSEILDETTNNREYAVKIVPLLRSKANQWRYAKRIKDLHPEFWKETFRDLIMVPFIDIRDQLGDELTKAEAHDIINGIVDTVLDDFRQYSHVFIWLSSKRLGGSVHWLQDKLPVGVIIDRLLLLIDYMTSQAKRRDKDEATELRAIAGDAREIVRKNNYAVFKENIQYADETTAQSIYRRAQANEGLDSRTSADLTTLVRARFPLLFESKTTEESIVPQGVICLSRTLEIKKALLKRMVEFDLPEVVREIETARGHGDLKENSEYHAAKDKQKLMASQVSELQEMLSSPQVVRFEEIDAEQVGFGTAFRVTPAGAEVQEQYYMLGPWESDPDRNILSYQAPFARFFIGAKVGDMVEVELPLHTGRYTIVSIEPLTDEKAIELNVYEGSTKDLLFEEGQDSSQPEPAEEVYSN